MQFWLNFFSIVVLIGIFAQWVAWKLRIPSILPLLIFGFAAGQFFGPDIELDNDVLFAVVSLAVSLIMLEGGLTLKFEELKEAGKPVFRLITLGVIITWILAGLTFMYIGGFDYKVSALLGAILTVTGPTVIGPLLRNVKPKRHLNSILKWEGIVVDPIGALLAVLVFVGLLSHGHGNGGGGLSVVLIQLAITLVTGIGLGWGVGKGLIFILRRHWIPDYLQSVIVLAVGLGLFTLSNAIQKESGLLTVTVLGVVLINQARAQIRHIIEFKENLRVLLISCLFIILGGRIGWEELVAVWKQALLISLVLIVIVRPASIFLSCIGTSLDMRERWFLALLAPRGIVAAAVSTIFAIELSHLGGEYIEAADKIPPIIFSIIFYTVTFYGLFAGTIAKFLKLATPNPQGIVFAGATPFVIELARAVKREGFEVLIIDSNHRACRDARMRGIRAHTASVMSDYAIEEIDMSGIGRFIAMTPNDEVNSLACIGFAHAMGRSNVFQTEPHSLRLPSRNSSSMELSGRYLFREGITSSYLNEKYSGDIKISSTPITEEFSYEKFLESKPDALPLMIIRANGDLAIMTNETIHPGPGDAIMSVTKIEEPKAM